MSAPRTPHPLRLPPGLVTAKEARTVFSHNLSAFRQRAGLTQTALALRVGLRPGTLSTYEHGTEPPIGVLICLANALNLTLDQLLPTADLPK